MRWAPLGDLTPDAYIGALAIDHGRAVASLDRDVARFDRVVAPPRRLTG